MTREIIRKKIEETEEKIRFYQVELQKIKEENLLFSDEQQWFVEKEEEVKFRQNRKVVTENKLIGRVFWKQRFLDEDTGKAIEVVRNQIIRENGEFIV